MSKCGACGKESAKLLQCARCKTVGYCDQKCQHAHWKVHKNECGKPQPTETAEKIDPIRLPSVSTAELRGCDLYDVQRLMVLRKCSASDAVAAIEKHENDYVEAIFELTPAREESHFQYPAF